MDNLLIAAVAWKQTAAEYRALYHQGYNVARMQVGAGAGEAQTRRPPARGGERCGRHHPACRWLTGAT